LHELINIKLIFNSIYLTEINKEEKKKKKERAAAARESPWLARVMLLASSEAAASGRSPLCKARLGLCAFGP
jgi:hypothetical protein